MLRTKAKRTPICFLIATQLFLIVAGCAHPSETDLKKLKLLEDLYGKDYKFELSGDFYLEVTSRKNAQVTENDLIDIYKAFFFDESGTKKRETTFIYLNWYKHWGGWSFQYQIFYDPRTNEFKKSRASHS